MIDWASTFIPSEWFTRGWTLQELIAPPEVWFYGADWTLIGLRSTMAEVISAATKIDASVLLVGGHKELDKFSIASRMAWASYRHTTRPEDRAYSLMGLFSVKMATLYGEGLRAAFFRLQIEICKVSTDQSILAWYPMGKYGSSYRPM